MRLKLIKNILAQHQKSVLILLKTKIKIKIMNLNQAIEKKKSFA